MIFSFIKMDLNLTHRFDHVSPSLSPIILLSLHCIWKILFFSKCHKIPHPSFMPGGLEVTGRPRTHPFIKPHHPRGGIGPRFPSASPCHLEQIQMIKWQALPREDALFPRKLRRFASIQFSRCKSLNVALRIKTFPCSLSVFPLPCKQC